MIQGMTAERGVDFVICGLCGGQFRAISNSHLTRRHGFDPENPIREYLEMFGLESAECVETRQQQKEAFREHLDRHGRSWSAERVCREIARLRGLNEPLNSKHIVQHHQQLMISAREYYGTWDRALEAAGVEVDQVRLHNRWTPEKILGLIRELAAQGCSLAYTECNARGDGLAQAARRAFGDWKSALRAAGIEEPWTGCRRSSAAAGEAAPQRKARWTPESILNEIRRMVEAAETLQPRQVAQGRGGLWSAARREFGSWARAVRASGVPYAHAERGAKGPALSLPAAAAAPSQEALPTVHEWPVNSPVVA